MSRDNLFLPYTNNKDADQPAHPRSLISTFVVSYFYSIIPLLAKYELSRLLTSFCSCVGEFEYYLVTNPRKQVFLWRGSFESRHDKTNKMSVCPAKIQVSLGIRPVWSESSLCTQWVVKDPSLLHADSEDSDQTGRMPRLIRVFAGRTVTLKVLSCCSSFGPLAEKRDLIPNSENLKIMYILKILSVYSNSWKYQCTIIKELHNFKVV